MNEEIKKVWIEALESGDYEQGTGQLQTRDDQFCCLGVLCDLAVKAGVVKRKPVPRSGYAFGPADETDFALTGEWNRLALPPVVVQWAGLPDGDPIVGDDGYGEPLQLSVLNDGNSETGKPSQPFSVIANAIRERL